jgi:hypothetical protein
MELDALKYNSIVLNGFEFIEQNPLGFFEFDDILDKEKVFQNKISNFCTKGTLTVKDNGFIPDKDENGNNISKKDIFVVTRAKSRPVLIFQDIEFCKQYHNNVFIIPIQTLKKPSREKCNSDQEYLEKIDYYNKVKNRDLSIPHEYYIPTETIDGQLWERVLFLHDARFVHMSTLYGQVIENTINKKDLKEITNRLSRMLNIKNVHECENCEYYQMFETMKKIISRVERIEKGA